MKIAVPIIGNKLTDSINDRFGRAEAIIVYNDGDIKVLNNPAVNAAGGAGVKTAQLVSEEDVQVVIAMRVGPKALEVLKAASIELYQGVNGTVQDNIKAFELNNLNKMN